MKRVVGQNGQSARSPERCRTLTPSPSPSRERGAVDPLELIAEGRHSVEAICRESNISILELARMVTAPDNLDQLHQVAQLHAIEREMMLGRLKRNALVRLAELTEEVPAASPEEVRATEVMRKACVDLLRYGDSSSSRPASQRKQSPPPVTNTLSPLGEEKVLALWERMGEAFEEEVQEYPQIEDSPACPTGRGRIAKMGREENENEKKDTDEPRSQASGAGVKDVEITHKVQVGMAFGKTSDHGTGSNCTRTRPVPPISHRGITSSDTGRTPAGIPSTEDRPRKSHNEILLDEAHPP